MKYTSSFLSHFLTIQGNPELLAEDLTPKSCEVEEVHTRLLPSDLVIGKVTAVEKHANADTLFVCQVTCGEKGDYQICTGGENVVVGGYVPVAIPGCHLPSINLTIEKRKLRGEDSHGMICSKKELGIDEDNDEHWIRNMAIDHSATKKTGYGALGELQGDWPSRQGDLADLSDADIGFSVGEKYPWMEGWIMEVENKTITHRPDMFGHFGLATELGWIGIGDRFDLSYGSLWKNIFDAGHTDFSQLGKDHPSHGYSVEVLSPFVESYSTIHFDVLPGSRSSFQNRVGLLDSGFEPKSALVDCSNMFMMVMGQPVHFFDAQKIQGTIVVRQATDGEEFTDLFGKTHSLLVDDIVISDDSGLIALAGIIGGSGSEVDGSTSSVLVEIANFDSVQVRKTGTRLGLRTDAELRFEKAINPGWTMLCVDYFSEVCDCLGYSFEKNNGYSSYRKAGSDIQMKKVISRDQKRVEALIFGDAGSVPEEFADYSSKILTTIGFFSQGDGRTAPLRRGHEDIERMECLIEEVTRLYGFDAIPELDYVDVIGVVRPIDDVSKRSFVEDVLSRLGGDQCETYPWLEQKRVDLLSLDTSSLLEMKNPLSDEQKFLRSTMLWSLLNQAVKNASLIDNFFMFDQGSVWIKQPEITEKMMIGGVVREKNYSDGIDGTFVQAKRYIQEVLALPLDLVTFEQTEYSYFHPTLQGVILYKGESIGSIGVLHTYYHDRCKLPEQGRCVLFELAFDAVGRKEKSGQYETVQDQILRRDTSFFVSKENQVRELVASMMQHEKITDVQVVDIYGGEGVEQGKISVTLRMKILGDGGFDAEQIGEVMKEGVALVEKNTGAMLRGDIG